MVQLSFPYEEHESRCVQQIGCNYIVYVCKRFAVNKNTIFFLASCNVAWRYYSLFVQYKATWNATENSSVDEPTYSATDETVCGTDKVSDKSNKIHVNKEVVEIGLVKTNWPNKKCVEFEKADECHDRLRIWWIHVIHEENFQI